MNDPFVTKVMGAEKPELKLALFSDLHIGADDIDVKAMRRDLSKCADEGRRFSINGDIAELVLPSDKKRYTPSKAMSQRDDVINETMEACYKELRPFVDYIDVIGTGNHDENPIKFNSFDLVGALIVLLNRERSSSLPPIHRAGYQGYMRYQVKISTRSTSFTVYHHHGGGGSAPVSKGMIDFNRMVYSHDADLYWMGHKHTALQDAGIVRDKLNSQGAYIQQVSKAVITPGYKSHGVDGSEGYKIRYSDKFYNMQAKGYAVVDVFINHTTAYIENFDVTLRT